MKFFERQSTISLKYIKSPSTSLVSQACETAGRREAVGLHIVLIIWYSSFLQGQVPGLVSNHTKLRKQWKATRNVLLVQSNLCY